VLKRGWIGYFRWLCVRSFYEDLGCEKWEMLIIVVRIVIGKKMGEIKREKYYTKLLLILEYFSNIISKYFSLNMRSPFVKENWPLRSLLRLFFFQTMTWSSWEIQLPCFVKKYFLKIFSSKENSEFFEMDTQTQIFLVFCRFWFFSQRDNLKYMDGLIEIEYYHKFFSKWIHYQGSWSMFLIFIEQNHLEKE